LFWPVGSRHKTSKVGSQSVTWIRLRILVDAWLVRKWAQWYQLSSRCLVPSYVASLYWRQFSISNNCCLIVLCKPVLRHTTLCTTGDVLSKASIVHIKWETLVWLCVP
jgi:hypothetical protein